MGNGKLPPAKKLILGIGIILLVLAVTYVLLKTLNPKTNTNPNACINRTFSLGASGRCISDGQNLVNYYVYGIDQPNYLAINGLFNATLQAAVKSAQTGASLRANGELDPATWKLLCRSQDTPAWWTVAAKDAGCPQF